MGRSDLFQLEQEVAWQDAVEATRRLRAAGLQPLLLHSAGAHPEARHSVIGLNPLVEIRITGRDIEERWADGAIEAFEDEPVAYLRRMLDRYRFATPPGKGFTGGWVGLIGFGFSRTLEPSLPTLASSVLPDIVLRLCRDAIQFDHTNGKATLWTSAPDGDREGAALRQAAARASLGEPVPATAPCRVTALWSTSMEEGAFVEKVVELKRLIHQGDLFQANLATRFEAPFEGDLLTLVERLATTNPSPYMAYLDFGGFAVASGSPEQLFASGVGRIRARPIAGTRKRGSAPEADAAMERELLDDAKEQAEHTMLVDLVRNDLAGVARPGTVAVPERGSVERYSHVMHLVSRVEAELRPDAHILDQVAALFPGGTVTGAPKVRATQRILELEPVERGFYTGSAGWIGWDHAAHWNILIRTFVATQGRISVHAGSGIVADSDPAREWREANRKAQALLEAATGATTGDRTRLGEVSAHNAWSPPTRPARHAGKRVLVVDNVDSFVHNLADYCATLGATVQVIRNDADWRAAVAAFQPTHIILSPGPGWPAEAGCTMDVVRELHGRISILGVCLGHQAIGAAFGAVVKVHPAGPVHGKSDWIHHDGGGLLAGLASPVEAARYHSLIVEGIGGEWTVDGRLADGTIMSLRHRNAPTYGLQFHPESLCTPHGLEILDHFLESTA
ncbi:MAG: chorismate-binding protein [Candidatus Thermoplasmatota archaeon]